MDDRAIAAEELAPIQSPTSSQAFGFLFEEEILAVVCIIFTVSLYLSGFAVISMIRQRKSTHGISILPFLTCAVSNTVWLKYAFLRNDSVLMTTNGFGACLEWLYVLIYMSYMPQADAAEKTVKKWLIIQLGFMFFVLLVCAQPKFTQEEFDALIDFMVKVCVFTNICNYISPVAQCLQVIQVKNTESLSLSMSIAYFLMTVAWLQYGVVTGKVVVIIPNMLGVVLTSLTLVLFFIYPKRRSVDGKKQTA